MSKNFTTVQCLCLTVYHAIIRVEMEYGFADSKALALMDVSAQMPVWQLYCRVTSTRQPLDRWLNRSQVLSKHCGGEKYCLDPPRIQHRLLCRQSQCYL